MNASLFINFFKLLLNRDNTLFGILLVCLLINIICLIIAAIFTILIILDTSNDKLKKNPLNKETLTFEIQDACNILFMTSKYPYGIIIWLMFVNIILTIYALIRVFTNPNIKKEESTDKTLLGNSRLTLIVVVIVFAILNVIVFGICLYLFLYTKLKINTINNYIVDFNGYIIQNMYKTQDILLPLQNMPSNSLQIMHNIEESIINYLESHDEAYFKDENNYKVITNDLGKLFFTFDLYQHYIQMGLNNPSLHSALKNIFNITNIFTYTIHNNIQINISGPDSTNETLQEPSIFKDTDNSTWPATDNLIKKYTFIKDYSNQYIELVQNSISKNEKSEIRGNTIQGECLLNAANIASNVCVNASQKANNFNLESTLNSFMFMSTFILISLALPFIIIWLILMTDIGSKFQSSVTKETEKNSLDNIKTKETEIANIKDEFNKLENTYKINNTLNGGVLTEDKKIKLIELSNDSISLANKIMDISSSVNDSSKTVVNKFSNLKELVNTNTQENQYKEIESAIPSIRIANTIIGDSTVLFNKIYQLLKDISNLNKDNTDNSDTTNNLIKFNRLISKFSEQKSNVEETYKLLIKENSKNTPLVSENLN
jgi:hypothetical protein